ncbi:acetylserotonin O-methyltransferase [Chromobacterium phragmitis]|uniref:methyltransferase n=1 Tax=Chromobacterium phragmitis TaxID=2202141 RepID=UPI000DECB868|nr:methyltransferase [Chromobacterium phragmitis]AXE31746.1 acetylserotonin O-methyltransferase [Chromobacterium phragmitis]
MEIESAARQARHSDKQIFDIYFGFLHSYALLFADEVRLFELLRREALTLDQISAATSLPPRSAQALASLCASLGLLEKRGETFTLASLAEAFLTREAETSFCGVLASARSQAAAFSYDFFKASLLKGESQLFGGTDLFDNNAQDAEHCEIFTRAMHSKSKGPARAWVEKIDLSNHACLLDVGGGSGVHALSALARWPQLRAVVFDLPPVCAVADTFIEQYRMQERARTCGGNIWETAYPAADAHFYSDIFHDWPLEKCLFLARKSFSALPSGGRILLHEMLFNAQKTGPGNVAAYNANMLLWTQGQQLSAPEATGLLQAAGFADIATRSTGYGDWSLVTGVKP